MNFQLKSADHTQRTQIYRIILGSAVLSGRAPDSVARGRGFNTYLRRVVLLSKARHSPKSINNTQEAVATSQHD